jgi:hypothetical protein
MRTHIQQYADTYVVLDDEERWAVCVQHTRNHVAVKAINVDLEHVHRRHLRARDQRHRILCRYAPIYTSMRTLDISQH